MSKLKMTDIQKYMVVRKTVIEMMNDRKYSVESKLDVTEDEALKEMNNSSLKVTKKNEEIVIYFCDDKKMGVAKIRQLHKNIKETKKHIIVISKYPLTSQSTKFINENMKDIEFEFFLEKDLLFNITKHYLQPKYRLLNNDEIDELLKTFNCKISNLPKIMIHEPICKYFNVKKKDVFEIRRKDGSIYYRSVI